MHKLHGIDFSQKIPLTDIYKLSGYGQTTLSKLFKQYMGQTLISYINDLKLDYACSLLTNTDYNTLSISSSLGFDSLSHFNHLFKKKFNMSPLQYRKAHLF
ncbi:MAG: helix-turn-helix transcriptional regulator [Clostridia bacterium]|nr:helix-turn-helix transcriptional regulator [Clostridia bacterium]